MQDRPSSPPQAAVHQPGTDAELLELARARSPEFAGRMYDRFSGDVNRVVFKVLGPDPDHDDLVQDTFVQVLRHAHTVRDADRFASWVVSVAVHTVYQELKRRRLRRWLSASNAVSPLAVDDGPDHEARELLTAVYRVLNDMPPAERQAFALRHLDGRQMGEIAQLSRCSLSTAKRTLARAESRFETLAARHQPELLRRLRRSKGEEQ